MNHQQHEKKELPLSPYKLHVILSGPIPFLQHLNPDAFALLLRMANECIANDCYVIPLRLEQLQFQPSKHVRNCHIHLRVCKTTSNNQMSAFALQDPMDKEEVKKDQIFREEKTHLIPTQFLEPFPKGLKNFSNSAFVPSFSAFSQRYGSYLVACG